MARESKCAHNECHLGVKTKESSSGLHRKVLQRGVLGAERPHRQTDRRTDRPTDRRSQHVMVPTRIAIKGHSFASLCPTILHVSPRLLKGFGLLIFFFFLFFCPLSFFLLFPSSLPFCLFVCLYICHYYCLFVFMSVCLSVCHNFVCHDFGKSL